MDIGPRGSDTERRISEDSTFLYVLTTNQTMLGDLFDKLAAHYERDIDKKPRKDGFGSGVAEYIRQCKEKRHIMMMIMHAEPGHGWSSVFRHDLNEHVSSSEPATTYEMNNHGSWMSIQEIIDRRSWEGCKIPDRFKQAINTRQIEFQKRHAADETLYLSFEELGERHHLGPTRSTGTSESFVEAESGTAEESQSLIDLVNPASTDLGGIGCSSFKKMSASVNPVAFSLARIARTAVTTMRPPIWVPCRGPPYREDSESTAKSDPLLKAGGDKQPGPSKTVAIRLLGPHDDALLICTGKNRMEAAMVVNQLVGTMDNARVRMSRRTSDKDVSTACVKTDEDIRKKIPRYRNVYATVTTSSSPESSGEKTLRVSDIKKKLQVALALHLTPGATMELLCSPGGDPSQGHVCLKDDVVWTDKSLNLESCTLICLRPNEYVADISMWFHKFHLGHNKPLHSGSFLAVLEGDWIVKDLVNRIAGCCSSGRHPIMYEDEESRLALAEHIKSDSVVAKLGSRNAADGSIPLDKGTLQNIRIKDIVQSLGDEPFSLFLRDKQVFPAHKEAALEPVAPAAESRHATSWERIPQAGKPVRAAPESGQRAIGLDHKTSKKPRLGLAHFIPQNLLGGWEALRFRACAQSAEKEDVLDHDGAVQHSPDDPLRDRCLPSAQPESHDDDVCASGVASAASAGASNSSTTAQNPPLAGISTRRASPISPSVGQQSAGDSHHDSAVSVYQPGIHGDSCSGVAPLLTSRRSVSDAVDGVALGQDLSSCDKMIASVKPVVHEDEASESATIYTAEESRAGDIAEADEPHPVNQANDNEGPGVDQISMIASTSSDSNLSVAEPPTATHATISNAVGGGDAPLSHARSPAASIEGENKRVGSESSQSADICAKSASLGLMSAVQQPRQCRNHDAGPVGQSTVHDETSPSCSGCGLSDRVAVANSGYDASFLPVSGVRARTV